MQHEDSQHIKADAGKTRPMLIEQGFARALRLVQATTDYGAQKYAPNSWQDVPNAVERYLEAGARHRQQRYLNRDIFSPDPESGLPHIAHELFCLMAVIEMGLQEEGERFGTTVEYLCKFNQPPQDHKQ